jgi:hypothetical protein
LQGWICIPIHDEQGVLVAYAAARRVKGFRTSRNTSCRAGLRRGAFSSTCIGSRAPSTWS